MKTASLIVAVVLCLLAGCLGFGWFGSSTELPRIVGLAAFGAAFGWLSFLLPPP